MTGRDRYPKNWPKIARLAKERVGWVCEVCQVMHGQIVRSRRTGNLYMVYLQAAHINHDQWNPSAELRVVCPTCHGRYFRRRRQSFSETLCKRRCALRAQEAKARKRKSYPIFTAWELYHRLITNFTFRSRTRTVQSFQNRAQDKRAIQQSV